MTRFAAFACFLSAALDWPGWWLDRAGVAALGFAFLSLAVGRALPPLRSPLPFGVPKTTVAVADEAAETAASLAQRIAAYEP